MKSIGSSEVAGWSALASAVATILGIATLIAFFVLGEPWGTINDIASILLALLLLPVLLALHRLNRRQAPPFTLAATLLGALGLLVAVVFQTCLVLRLIGFEQTAVAVPAAFGLFGAALMAHSLVDRTARSMARGLGWLGTLAGAGYVLVIVGIIMGGQEHPLAAIGGLAAVICYPIWAIRFGRLLLSGKLTT